MSCRWLTIILAFLAAFFAVLALRMAMNPPHEPNPCIRTYTEEDGSRLCVLDPEWGAFIR